MKKLIFAVMALAFVAVSCQKDTTPDYSGKDAVTVTLNVDAPELGATRSNERGMNSALGAIDNITNANLWGEYDVRYMLEIYDVTVGFENTTTPVKSRMVNILPEYAPTTFEFRLIPNRKYKFVVWADFVAEGSAAATDPLTVTGLNYNTADLHNITRIAANDKPMHECLDAYFIQEDIEITSSVLPHTLTLTRPFGKLRVITTDIDDVNIGTTASQVKVTFYNHPVFVSLNAITGKTETTTETVTYTYDIAKDAPYDKGYDASAENQTLFAHYIYAQDEGEQEVNLTMDVIDQNNRPIRSHDFNTQIPLKRNHLTTIIGNLLTTATEFQILIDDNFENKEDDEDWIVRVWDGKLEPLPAVGTDGVQDINTPGQFATYLLSDYRGKDARLNADIDLGGYEIKHTINNGSGDAFVFDGQGYTVSNFTVSDGVNAGLFSILTNATVKNLTIKHATVAPNAETRAYNGGNFYAGALAGTTQGYCTIENVHVVDCEIEGVNKVGGLIGNAAENFPLVVKGCSVEDSKVYTTSTEDGGCVGGLIGYVKPNTTLEGNSVRGTTIEAINSRNNAERGNAEFIGTFHGEGNTMTLTENKLELNTFTQTETTYVTPEAYGAWLGAIRIEKGADVIIDGKSVFYVEPVVLATPDVTATPEGKVINLSWAAIENAGSYTISMDNEALATVTEPTYKFTGEFDTEYTFSVVALPADEKKYIASEVAVVTAKTEAAKVLEAPAVAATLNSENDKQVIFSWGEVVGAAAYRVTYGEVTSTTTDVTYTVDGVYGKTYSISVVAIPAEDTTLYIESSAAEASFFIEDPYIYLKPNSNWKADNARFAVYTWAEGVEATWHDMTDSDGDGIYEVKKASLKSDIIFCRMSGSSTENNWTNKWNQTTDLKFDGTNNLFTVPDGVWDNANSTWSVMNH